MSVMNKHSLGRIGFKLGTNTESSCTQTGPAVLVQKWKKLVTTTQYYRLLNEALETYQYLSVLSDDGYKSLGRCRI